MADGTVRFGAGQGARPERGHCDVSTKEKSTRSDEPRRARDRSATEERILRAAWRLFKQGGPLAGLNLQEVADEAGVNRSLVYQYFGTREELVARALASQLDRARARFNAGAARPFIERRREAFSIVASDPTTARVITQLVLAGDREVKVLPMLEGARNVLARDLEDGSLPPGSDAEVMQAMTSILHLAYAVFREPLARELKVRVTELDDRAKAVFELMLRGLVAGPATD